MKVEEILQSITLQGAMMDLDTGLYRRMIVKDEAVHAPNEFVWLVSELVSRCANGEMDPWDVDVSRLTTLFSEAMDQNHPNFALAGRFIAESWRFLYEKSEDLIRSSEPEEELDQELPEIDNPAISEVPGLEVRPRIYHQEKRKVLLLEVLESMRSLYSYTRRAAVVDRIVHLAETSSIEEIIVELNAEEPEIEKMKIWQMILDYGYTEFPMEEIWGHTRSEQGSFFAYSLFLAREKKIILGQKQAYGSVTIKKLQE